MIRINLLNLTPVLLASDNKYCVFTYLRTTSNGLVHLGYESYSSVSILAQSPFFPGRVERTRKLTKFGDRVISRLYDAASRERDPHLADNYHIAIRTVNNCAIGCPTPWEVAFAEYLGQHPSKLIPFLVERARLHAEAIEREQAYLPPKKPSQSVRQVPERKRAA